MMKRPTEGVWAVLMVLVFIWISEVYALGENRPETTVRIKADRGLLVPGGGGEMVILGEPYRETVERIGKPGKSGRLPEPRDIFSDAMGVKASPVVLFDRLYHYPAGGFTVFVRGDRVVAVSGRNTNRTTLDGVALSKGISYFILHYGNRDCEVLASGGNRLYVYGRLGIALADDGDNGSIDLYFVFIPFRPEDQR